MKRLAIIAAITMIPGVAFAQSSESLSQSGSQAYAGINNVSHGVRQSASAIAPGLASSGASCRAPLISFGYGGVGGAGAGGIFTNDGKCDTREDAKYIHGTTGSTNAAKERLCQDRAMRKAFQDAGEPCVADRQRAATVTMAAARPKAPKFNSLAECEAFAARHGGSCSRR